MITRRYSSNLRILQLRQVESKIQTFRVESCNGICQIIENILNTEDSTVNIDNLKIYQVQSQNYLVKICHW